MRHPRSAHRALPRAMRGLLWVVLGLLLLASATLCQAVMSSPSDQVEPAPVVATSCAGDLGHDVLCSRGVAAATAAGARSGRDDTARDRLGPLVAPTLVGALLAIAVGLLGADSRRRTGAPPWSPQRSVSGRHQLVAIGISRI